MSLQSTPSYAGTSPAISASLYAQPHSIPKPAPSSAAAASAAPVLLALSAQHDASAVASRVAISANRAKRRRDLESDLISANLEKSNEEYKRQRQKSPSASSPLQTLLSLSSIESKAIFGQQIEETTSWNSIISATHIEGKRQGRAEETFQDGSKLTFQYIDDRRQGRAQRMYHDGGVGIFHYVDGVAHGPIKFTNKSGDFFECERFNGNLQGRFTYSNPTLQTHVIIDQDTPTAVSSIDLLIHPILKVLLDQYPLINGKQPSQRNSVSMQPAAAAASSSQSSTSATGTAPFPFLNNQLQAAAQTRPPLDASDALKTAQKEQEETFPDGSKLKCSYQNGQRNGSALLTYKDGSTLSCQIVNDKRQGPAIFTNKEITFEFHYKDDMCHGPATETDRKGRTLEFQYVEGKRQGKAIQKDSSGTIGEFYYVNSKRQGVLKKTLSNGIVLELQIFNEKLHSPFICYHPILKSRITIKHDLQVGANSVELLIGPIVKALHDQFNL